MKENEKIVEEATKNPDPKSTAKVDANAGDQANMNASDKENAKANTKSGKWLIIGGILVIIAAIVILMVVTSKDDKIEESAPVVEESTEPESEAESAGSEVEEDSVVEEESEAEPSEPTMLPELAAKYEENQDMAGWITIENTRVDYPVMYTPDDEEKYLYANFDAEWDVNGLPFIDKDCSCDPESMNLIIYGHNMLNDKAFSDILEYQNEEFWKEHPVVKFSTLYEEREYEVLAAFHDRVYYKHETCFKFYQFIDAEDEEQWDEAITYYKENALYDTGVDAEYGDKLITLVTCADYEENGRFVVVARMKSEE